jgi:hypothetical protein
MPHASSRLVDQQIFEDLDLPPKSRAPQCLICVELIDETQDLLLSALARG